MIEDTIAAIATPVGRAGIGVIRISGAAAIGVADTVFKTKPRKDDLRPSDFASHTVHLGAVIHPQTGEMIDEALLTVFRSPYSYTGEDVAEISCHGGTSTMRRVLDAVLQAGARHAEPGEFTKRAFLNGRMDLAQAEAVNDLIRAETDEAQRVALRQLEGNLSKEIKSVTSELSGILAAVEASIDFPDDVDEPGAESLRNGILQVSRRLETLLSTADRGRIYREGIALAIVGRPNVGKSSLLNALLRQSRAIVTPIPGTTRDTIEETININGIPVVAIDTAGLRETEDAIELVGVKKAEETIERAGVVLLVLDAQEVITGEDVELRRKFTGKPALVVLNKVDLLTEAELKRCLESASNSFGSDAIMAVSALTGYGIEALEDRIAEVLLGGAVSSTDSVLVSNVRHKRAMESALAGLRHAGQTVDDRQPVDLVSIDLMAARNSLGEITGETAAEDLIDRIFSEFCIGK